MKPHRASPASRPFSFGVSAGILLLVSACSTWAPPTDPAPAAAQEDAAAANQLEGLHPDVLTSRPLSVRPAPLTRMSSRRAATSPNPRPPLTLDPFERGADEQSEAAIRALIDTYPEEAGPQAPAIAGPEPKLEPLARHANRPYRLRGRKYRPMTDLQPFKQRGIASWYGKRFHGRRTATGERFDMNAMSAAHPTLPLPSYVRVTNLKSGTSVIVRVNDRGPFAHDRVIDLSKAAATHLGMVQGGLAAVELNLIVPEPTGVELPAAVAGVAD